MWKSFLIAGIGALAVIMAPLGIDHGRALAQGGPLPVEVAAPVQKKVIEWDEYTGRFEATKRVEVRARVSGYLQSVHFQDGQLVGQGDLLFIIDPRPFEAELAGAKAQLSVAKSQLALADVELKRAENLGRTQAASRALVDQRRAAREQAEAGVAVAEAEVREAELNVEFTQVRSPITGRISNRQVDVGNLVSGGTAQSTVLTTVVAMDPIYFVFDASEADFLRYSRLNIEGTRVSSRERANPVYVRLMDEENWDRLGKMNFVDNVLDPNSGTIRGRAIFDNPDFFLTPGVFGRLRLLGSSEYEALLLPDEAVLSDQSRKVVMTVDDKGVVVPKPVTLGPVIEGLRVIRSGIEPTDQVIIKGLQRARPGATVKPEPGKISVRGTGSPAG
ncbi:MAG: efflux RND transporter periplasmic adaptor subunit [Pseudomonadota bacterium]